MHKSKRITVAITILVPMIGVGSTIRAVGSSPEEPEKLSRAELTDRLDFTADRVFYGGVMIAADDTLVGPVVVIRGALDIQDRGVLLGDAWIINGKLILNGLAAVTGVTNLVNSTEYMSRQSAVHGGIRYYSCECALDAESFETEARVSFIKKEDPKAIKIKRAVKIGDLNRTEYSILKIGLERFNPRRKDPYIRGHALLHVPIWKENGGFLGFDVDLAVPLKGRSLELVLQGFKRSWTNDNWQLSLMENSLIVALTGNDFLDYFERRGASIGIRFRPKEYLAIESNVSYQEDVSLRAREIPSFLKGYDCFRENPPIADGNRLALSGSFIYDTRYDPIRPAGAWYISLMIEKGVADGPGDFSYTTFEADVRRYNSLPFGLNLDVRGRCFSSFDPVPPQATRSLNGYGGIRGTHDFPFPVARGNRLALFSIELRTGMPALPLLRKFLLRWNFLVFSDMGLLVMEDHARRPFDFLDTPFDRWKQTIGLGITAESFLPYVGLFVAQDLDQDKFEPRVIFRVQRSF